MTIQEFIKTSGMTHKQLSDRFGIPKRTIEDWSRGARKCPDYVVNMMIELLKGDAKMKIQFEAGEGRHFDGGVNFLIGESEGLTVYAEVEVPDDASEDYGYITMKNKILSELTEAQKAGIKFWYDGQEQFLADDASADCEVYVSIE